MPVVVGSSNRRATTNTSLPLQSAPSTRVDVLDKKTGEVRARDLINFASYNYLGLSYREEVKEAIKAKRWTMYGGGASGSPILSGTTALHQELWRRRWRVSS